MAKVYQNNAGIFSDIGVGLTGVYYSSLAWGDYDNDGDLDILLTGQDSLDNYVAKVYRISGGIRAKCYGFNGPMGVTLVQL